MYILLQKVVSYTILGIVLISVSVKKKVRIHNFGMFVLSRPFFVLWEITSQMFLELYGLLPLELNISIATVFLNT